MIPYERSKTSVKLHGIKVTQEDEKDEKALKRIPLWCSVSNLCDTANVPKIYFKKYYIYLSISKYL